MKIDIGLSEKARQKIAGDLGRLLADSYTLYLKTHNYHWNVTGPEFRTLHLMFEEQYNELALAVDLVAERIRALGYPAPASYKAFSKLTSITEEDDIPKAQDMIKNLIKGHEAVIKTARSTLPAAAEAHDETTVSLLSDRLNIHEKTAWMLRSLLG